MRQFTINLKPEVLEIPDLDVLTAQEIPVHATETADARDLERRSKSEQAEAREKAVLKIKNKLALEDLYRRLTE